MDHPLPYSEAELEERLSRPSEAVQEAVQQLTGDVAVKIEAACGSVEVLPLL